MTEKDVAKMLSRRAVFSLLGLAAVGLALPSTVLIVSEAEAQGAQQPRAAPRKAPRPARKGARNDARSARNGVRHDARGARKGVRRGAHGERTGVRRGAQDARKGAGCGRGPRRRPQPTPSNRLDRAKQAGVVARRQRPGMRKQPEAGFAVCRARYEQGARGRLPRTG
jgi:hypothetical protein